MLEELRKNREFREQGLKGLTEMRPRFRPEEHERRLEEIKKEGEQRRQEDREYRERLFDTLNRLIEVASELAKKLDKVSQSNP